MFFSADPMTTTVLDRAILDEIVDTLPQGEPETARGHPRSCRDYRRWCIRWRRVMIMNTNDPLPPSDEARR